MRKSTRRKIYPLINPIEHAIEGASFMSQNKQASMRANEIAAIEAFRVGKAGLQQWHDLNEMASLSEVMARAGVGVEVLAVSLAAQIYLKEASNRYKTMGKMGFSGVGLTTLIDLREYHDLQRQVVTHGDYWNYIKEMINLKKSGSPLVQVL
jgi:hypothetical protein